MTQTPPKRTPLYEGHLKLNGKIVEFAGWEMPVQYAGVIAEHVAVRERAGLFDVSHMGEIWVTGAEAERALEYLTCNKVSSLYDGKAQYSAILNENGGVIDDIIIYRFSADRFLLCVNASNADRDYEWLAAKNPTKAAIRNASAEYGQIAVQGPRAVDVLNAVLPDPAVKELQYFHFLEHEIGGTPVIIARTGYTGEDGFEIFIESGATPALWDCLLEAGREFNVEPCGLGARDSLRLEAALPLHGHELSEEISALESGLGWIVKLDKGDFIGRAALAAQKVTGVPRRLVGFFLDEAGIARQGDAVAKSDESQSIIGTVTSGTKTPTVNKALGLALVEIAHAALETPLSVVVRGRAIRAHVVPTPFYKRAVSETRTK